MHVVAGEVLGIVERAGGAVAPEKNSAAEWPPTAQKRPGCRRAMSSAPKPPIEIPPIAIRRGSACSRASACGITSLVT